MYPMMISLKGRHCLVIGAGKVAQRRILALLREKAQVLVLAPEPEPEALVSTSAIYVQDIYTPGKLAQYPATLVFAATDNPVCNQQIVQEAQRLGKLVSSVTPCLDALPDFSVPAQRQQGKVQLAVFTNGTVPALAGSICQALEPQLEQVEEMRQILEELRQDWHQEIPDANKRRALCAAMVTPQAMAILQAGGRTAYLQYGKRCAGAPGQSRAAVLMISFGTSYPENREKSIGAVELAIQQKFPETDVYRAFTSRILREKLCQEGHPVNSVSEALIRLLQMGYTQVYCQPTHVLPGMEYDKLRQKAESFQGCFSVLQMGEPLLLDTADDLALIQALEQEQIIRHSQETAYVLLGHGTANAASQTMPALGYWLKQRGYDNVLVGAVKGCPDVELVQKQLDAGSYKRVVLVPLLLAAGMHVRREIAGEGESSWKSVLERHGYAVKVQWKGLGEYPAVQELYGRKLEKLMEI